MRSKPIVRGGVLAGVLATVLMATAAEVAAGQTFTFGNCGADTNNESYNTRAFQPFKTRGMTTSQTCDPKFNGLEGVVTGSVFDPRRRVERGAYSKMTLEAPAGTQIVDIKWGIDWYRGDCRYALQIWTEAPDGKKLAMLKHRRANRVCKQKQPRWAVNSRRLSDVGPATGIPVSRYPIPPSARIVQRALCVGKNGSNCSASESNWIRTTYAQVTLVDVAPPTASILPDTPLARGEWVGGSQPLNYDAADNVGVRQAEAIGSGVSAGTHQRACSFAALDQVYADRVPCPNGPGTIAVQTKEFTDGTHILAVRAHDPAGNIGDSGPFYARVDNSPPGRVDTGVEGGDNWRNRNDFAVTWTNPVEEDRAPIAAVTYQICPVGGGSCSRVSQAGADIARLAVPVPAAGAWELSLWRRDAAGNETETAASVPVKLRYDPDPPQLAFAPSSTEDPTLVTVPVTETISGLAGGAIEISAAGSGVWQALPTQLDGERLTARIDDAALAPGGYQLRARAVDQAGNEASTERRADGEPMALTLPLRVGARMRAGFVRTRSVPRRGKRKGVRRVRVLKPATRVRHGRDALVSGRLVNRQGDGIGGAEVRVLSGSSTSPEQIVATLHTDSEGRYRYSAAGSSSRTLRFVYSGSPLVLPAERTVRITVPARTSLRVNRGRVLNGQAVTFSGRLRTQPAPPSGKLVELQARLSDRWQTFRTTRTDANGRWSVRYRFKRTRGVQRFRFRARLPEEAAYPFGAGRSPRISVRVKGM